MQASEISSQCNCTIYDDSTNSYVTWLTSKNKYNKCHILYLSYMIKKITYDMDQQITKSCTKKKKNYKNIHINIIFDKYVQQFPFTFKIRTYNLFTTVHASSFVSINLNFFFKKSYSSKLASKYFYQYHITTNNIYTKYYK